MCRTPGPVKNERLLMCTFTDQLTTIVPVAVAAALSTYLLTRYFSSQSSPKNMVNMSINKDSPKVVHSFDMEDIGNKAVYCRCWRSKKVSEPISVDHVSEFILIGWCGDSHACWMIPLACLKIICMNHFYKFDTWILRPLNY